MTDEKNNTGYRNTGNWNAGYSNTGDWNTGDWNTGYRNTGNWNAGGRNAGDWNTGYRNTGNWNAGGRNAGDWNTGYRNTGNWNAGGRNAGGRNAGNRNTGYSNTGNSNTGYRNAGYRNTGNWNAGGRNAGDWNTGDWNTVNYETGFLNTEQSEKVRVFNKECDRDTWENAYKPIFMYFNLTEWIADTEMTDQEKIDNETFHTTGGYLKSYEYKEAFQRSWNGASKEDRELVKKLPNFDAYIFLEISGIDVRKTVSGNPKEVIIDGETYVLKEK